MRVTLKAIDDELRRLGHDVHIEKGDGYFYFWKGEANDWLDPRGTPKTGHRWTPEKRPTR